MTFSSRRLVAIQVPRSTCNSASFIQLLVFWGTLCKSWKSTKRRPQFTPRLNCCLRRQTLFGSSSGTMSWPRSLTARQSSWNSSVTHHHSTCWSKRLLLVVSLLRSGKTVLHFHQHGVMSGWVELTLAQLWTQGSLWSSLTRTPPISIQHKFAPCITLAKIKMVLNNHMSISLFKTTKLSIIW